MAVGARRCWRVAAGRCSSGATPGAGRGPVRVACAALLKALAFARPGAQPARAAPDRHAAAARGERLRRSWPTTARACSSATTSDAATRGDWVRDRLAQGVRLEDPAGAGLRRPQLRLRLPPPRRRRLRRPGLRRHGHLARRPRSRPSRSGSAACRWPACSLFTDGNRTDVGDIDWSQLPPIYPVVPPSRGVARDVGVQRRLDQPDQLRVGPRRRPGRRRGRRLPRASRSSPPSPTRRARRSSARRRRRPATASRSSFRFQFRPEQQGVELLPRPRLRRLGGGQAPRRATVAVGAPSEQTLANNSRLVVVDQGGGPYRVLYVSGRPNWEFKFLRRALADDEQVQLVGLVRIARRQPKFDFQQPRATGPTSPLFDGFDHPDADTAERADQPVLVRLGTARRGRAAGRLPQDRRRALPLPRGRPRRPRGRLLHARTSSPCCGTSSSQRGGGLLMLGGPDSFADGKYDRTPVGELLPVYLNRPGRGPRRGRGRLPPGAHPRGLAPAVGPDAEDRGRGAAAAGRDAAVPDPQPGRAASSRGPSIARRGHATPRATPSPRWWPSSSARGTSRPC